MSVRQSARYSARALLACLCHSVSFHWRLLDRCVHLKATSVTLLPSIPGIRRNSWSQILRLFSPAFVVLSFYPESTLYFWFFRLGLRLGLNFVLSESVLCVLWSMVTLGLMSLQNVSALGSGRNRSHNCTSSGTDCPEYHGRNISTSNVSYVNRARAKKTEVSW